LDLRGRAQGLERKVGKEGETERKDEERER